MSHGISLNIDIKEAMEAEPIAIEKHVSKLLWLCVAVGIFTFILLLVGGYPQKLLWGAYYVNLTFWMGLSIGGLMVSAIAQIVRAKWFQPLRRISEANIAFLPWAYALFLLSYFGKEALFPWGDGTPSPGREIWMQPNFVYIRFAVLFAILFFLLWRFVMMSLRSDIGFLREKSKHPERWMGFIYKSLAADWDGSETETIAIQRKMSFNAPILIACYAVIYSLFAFEMIMSMDKVWYSNLFGAFNFIGNIYVGLAALTMLSVFLARRYPQFDKVLTTQSTWDIGKLTFAFCMLWGYMFLSQYLPQWYGNLPEETQWWILRSKEYPWKSFAWVAFPMAFIIPFILLLSEDLKRAPAVLTTVCLIIFLGIWCEKYIVIMPALSPEAIPFSIAEVGMFFGFLGIYGLSIFGFLKKFPFVAVSSPLTRGSTDW